MNKTQKAHLLVLAFGKMCVPRCVSYTTRRELLGCMVDIGLPCWLSGKESACHAGDLGLTPWVGKIRLEKGKATHSRILARRIPWTIQSMGSQRVRHNLAAEKQQRKYVCVYVYVFRIFFLVSC